MGQYPVICQSWVCQIIRVWPLYFEGTLSRTTGMLHLSLNNAFDLLWLLKCWQFDGFSIRWISSREKFQTERFILFQKDIVVPSITFDFIILLKATNSSRLRKAVNKLLIFGVYGYHSSHYRVKSDFWIRLLIGFQ